ncbi:MAG: DegT/DnrJ/EryC1/StrS aminotransferase family protein [Bacteroidales bacterium]|nr:DegT/DnrJ/EryC1/StrS aminotransferase family protein [Bacteroidales bacterium]
MKIPFSPPRIDDKIINEVADTLRSGWITTGPKTEKFERMLTEYAGHQATVCLNSATSGLEMVLRWFGVGEGDEVILPAYTYAASANVIVHCGATPVFIDAKDDFNIDVNEINKRITSKTKVILPVDIAGWPCDYEKINIMVQDPEVIRLFSPASENQEKLGRILVLADAAHSLGASYRNKRSGSLTDISVFSFHAVKNLTTAEGGAVCLNLPEPFDNEGIRSYLKVKSLHGQTKDAFSKSKAGNWRYDIIEPGYKCNMTDIQAAMGIVELERYDADMLPKRHHIFKLYTDFFSKFPWAILPDFETSNKHSSYHVFLLRIKDFDEVRRDKAIHKIMETGVAVNVHFLPLPMMTWYRRNGYKIDDYPQSYSNYEKVISLPVYYDLTDKNVNIVAETVAEAVECLLT